jgi:cell division septum initiation protein DivIVA
MTENLQETIDKLRGVELRNAVRGVDGAQVRELLDEAVHALTDAAARQAELRDELERLQAANDESAIGKALLAATHAGEALVAEGRETAASIIGEAEAEASALMERITAQAKEHEQEIVAARSEAEAALARAREELDRLENEAVQLRSLVADMERRIREIATGALGELEAFGASVTSTDESDLLADLRPAPERSDVASHDG